MYIYLYTQYIHTHMYIYIYMYIYDHAQTVVDGLAPLGRDPARHRVGGAAAVFQPPVQRLYTYVDKDMTYIYIYTYAHSYTHILYSYV